MRREAAWLGHAAGATILAGTLLNGLGVYAKRVGVIEKQAYEEYWVKRCGPGGTKAVWFGLGRRCTQAQPLERFSVRKPPLAAYVVAVESYEWPLKLAKDVVMLGLAALGMLVLISDPSRRVSFRHTLLPCLLGAYVLAWTMVVIARGDTLLGLVGLRSFGFLPVALLWASAASTERMASIASWSVGALCVEGLLLPWEMLRGVTDRPTLWSPIRTSGTLVHPNTLGIVCVAIVGFALSYRPRSGWNILLLLMALAIVACAASGVGWIVLALLAGTLVVDRVPVSGWTIALAALAVALLCLAALPSLTGRSDVFHSVLVGRLGVLTHLIQQDGLTLVLGRGMGTGTNAARTALGHLGPPMDSTVTVVLQQVGFVGLTLFYGILLQAWYRDRRAGMFLLSLLLASLAANVLEAFPVNALLGLSLARSLRSSRSHDGAAAS